MTAPRLAVEAIEEVLDYASLEWHELANLMPLIEGVKFEELRKDIAANGLKYRIVLYDGQVLDGRNRYRALRANGHSFTSADFETFSGDLDKARAYVISTNFQRRQMTNKDKEAMIRLVIERYPDESNREIARLCGSPPTLRSRWCATASRTHPRRSNSKSCARR